MACDDGTGGLAAPISVEQGVLRVLDYHEIERMARDPRVAGVGRSFLEFCGVVDGPLWEWFGELMFTTEGEAHHRLRRVVQRWFTAKAVERQREFAAEAVAERLGPLRAAGGGDILAALLDVPMVVMCRTLGIDAEQVPEVIAISDAVSPAFGLIRPDQVPAAQSATLALHTLTAEILADADDRLTPNDLIWGLRQDLSERETIVMVGSLLFGGHDTTSSQIGRTLQLMLQHPWVFDAVANGEVNAAGVVWETMRLSPAIGSIPRTLLEPMSLHGTDLPAGTLVWLDTSAAAMQRSVWGDPEVFRPQRFDEPACAKVQTFGAGAHYCMGVALARLVLEEVVAGVSRGVAGLAAVEDPATVPMSSVLASRPERVLVAC